IRRRQGNSPRVVLVAYADSESAAAPPVEEVAAFACRWPDVVFMVDTYDKGKDERTGQRRNLLDWLPLEEVRAHCRRCRQAGLKVALAGSLTRELLLELKPLAPDWFAVRGAACGKGQRQAEVEVRKVRSLVRALDAPTHQISSRKLTARI